MLASRFSRQLARRFGKPNLFARANTLSVFQSHKFQDFQQTRGFQSTKPAQNAVAAAEEKDEATTTSGLFGKLGLYPLAGLSACIAVNKELIILDEEFYLVANFSAFVFAAYVYTGDSLKVANAEWKNKAQGDILATRQAEVDLLRGQYEHVTAQYNQIPMYETMAEQYKTIMADWAAAQKLKARHEARADMERRLNAIVEAEEANRARETVQLADNASAWVEAQFAASDKAVRDQAIAFALSSLGDEASSTPSDPAKDPIKRLFIEYMESDQ